MTNRRFEDKVAIVTGGVSGIGSKITERLVAEGARVVVADINETLISDATGRFGPTAQGLVTDVTDEAQFEALIAETVKRFGTLDAMFNVAGGTRQGKLTGISYADWDFVIRLNLYSVFLGTRLAARQFIAEEKTGTIVNLASINSIFPKHFGAAYSTAKAGVDMVSRNAALEFGEYGIRVNAISPGLVETPLTKVSTDVPGVTQAFLKRIPLGRPAQPEEIASVALFLASEESSYISGANILVDGASAQTGYPDLRPFMGWS